MKKLSFSIRIDKVTPAHVYVSVFSNMIQEEYDHEQATRAKCGDLCFSVEEFSAWMGHVKPHLVLTVEAHREDLSNYTGWKPTGGKELDK